MSTKIYLAARYSRREELCGYRAELRELGFEVTSRWLDGAHQISDTGEPLGEVGERAVERGVASAAHFAIEDFTDLVRCDICVSFTEPPRSSANRGGRHVEFGVAIAEAKRLMVVGYRENVFHWLPKVEFFESWRDCRTVLEVWTP